MNIPQYFAQVTDGIVTAVHCVTSEFMAENPERYEGLWIETFVNLPNKTYAGIGYLYDAETNDFKTPTPTEI